MHNHQQVLLQTLPSFTEYAGNVDNEHVRITRTGTSLNAVIKSLNVRIDATWYGSSMNHQIFSPQSLCVRSYGHLGNCDRNPNNDVSIDGINDCKLLGTE